MVVQDELRARFVEWAHEKGCEFSPFISFQSSSLGGTGVFFSIGDYILQNGPLDSKDDLEVLRVPQGVTFSLDGFQSRLLPLQREFDANLDDATLRQSDVMIKFLELFQSGFEQCRDSSVKKGLNEANIIVGQIQVLVVLKQVRAKELVSSPFATLDQYLNLLQKTEVTATRTDPLYPEYLDLFKYNEREYRHRIERIKYDAVYATLDYFNIKHSLNDSFLREIELSVVSRLLEIPAATNTLDKGYGYEVSSTLVPIIDFVNHSNDELNAFFDVDPTNNDVLLRLHNDKLNVDQGQVELFIRYSDHEDVLKFIHTYGFIPRSVTVNPLYELPLDRAYINGQMIKSEVDGKECQHSLGLLLKWLHIQPQVQFIIQNNANGQMEHLRLNLDENFIVFGFVKGVKYFREAALGIVKHYSDLQDDEYVERLLDLEESLDNDVIEGYDVIPYSSTYVEGPVNLDSLVNSIPDEEINELMVEFIDWLTMYAKHRIEVLDRSIIQWSTDDQSTTSIVYQFAQFEKDLLSTFIKLVNDTEDKLELVVGAEELDEDWLKHRLGPRVVSADQRVLLFETYAIEGVESPHLR